MVLILSFFIYVSCACVWLCTILNVTKSKSIIRIIVDTAPNVVESRVTRKTKHTRVQNGIEVFFSPLLLQSPVILRPLIKYCPFGVNSVNRNNKQLDAIMYFIQLFIIVIHLCVEVSLSIIHITIFQSVFDTRLWHGIRLNALDGRKLIHIISCLRHKSQCDWMKSHFISSLLSLSALLCVECAWTKWYTETTHDTVACTNINIDLNVVWVN